MLLAIVLREKTRTLEFSMKNAWTPLDKNAYKAKIKTPITITYHSKPLCI